jgi:hypothetical protein
MACSLKEGWFGLGGQQCQLARVVVPFAVDPTEATPFTAGSFRDRLGAYYRSAVATLGTTRRFNPNLECVFVTNVPPPHWLARCFQRLNVGVAKLDAASPALLPARTTFRTSLYLFDAIRAARVSSGEAVAFLDPDVICVGPIRLTLRDGQVGCLPLTTGVNDSIKGVTLAQIAEISARWGRPLRSLPTHIGGEIVVVTPGALPSLTESVNSALALIESAQAPGFHNDEHVLTYACDENWRSMRSLIARVWTSSRYREAPEDLNELRLWHLPAEKVRGLQRVSRAVRRRSLERLPDSAARRLIGVWTSVFQGARSAG